MPASTWSSCVTSIATPIARAAEGSNSSAVALAASRLRSAIATFAPAARNTLAMSLPMPLAAPVMTATLSVSIMAVSPSL